MASGSVFCLQQWQPKMLSGRAYEQGRCSVISINELLLVTISRALKQLKSGEREEEKDQFM